MTAPSRWSSGPWQCAVVAAGIGALIGGVGWPQYTAWAVGTLAVCCGLVGVGWVLGRRHAAAVCHCGLGTRRECATQPWGCGPNSTDPHPPCAGCPGCGGPDCIERPEPPTA